MVWSLVFQIILGQLEESIQSFSGLVLGKSKGYPNVLSFAFCVLSMQQFLLVQQLQILTQKA